MGWRHNVVVLALAGPLVSLGLAGLFGLLAEWLSGSTGPAGILAVMLEWLRERGYDPEQLVSFSFEPSLEAERVRRRERARSKAVRRESNP